MDTDASLKSAAGTSLGLENTFKHPEGLLTARNLVRLLLIHKMEDKHPGGFQGSQQTLMKIPKFNPTMPYSLKHVLTFNDLQPKSKKRKGDDQQEATKKPRLDKPPKAKRPPKPKPQKKELAKYKLDHAVWMRILEFTPPQFLGKARLICKDFQSMVDQFTSIYANCRKENYGQDMPPPPLGLTERQYSNLLGSKGCLEPGCPDKGASRTHWSWGKRWCVNCWRSKIERGDRLIKNRADRMGNRTTFMKLLECIPVGMHDSFMKPHDYVDVDNNRPRGAPRLYKYYLKADVEKIIERYEHLTPEPYLQDPIKTAEENAAALTRYQDEMSKLDEKRTDFLAAEKAKIDEHMVLVQKIEAGVRERRETLRTPYDRNRAARKELFTRRAKEDLPLITEEFVTSSTAFKAATRVFRDGGTERGWQTLKPKIEKEWASRWRTQQGNTSKNDSPQMDGAAEDWQLAPDRTLTDEVDFDIDINNPPADVLHNYVARHVCNQSETKWDFRHRTLGSLHSDLVNMPPGPMRPPPPQNSLQPNGAADVGGLDEADFDAIFASIDNSQTRHFQNNIAGFGHTQTHAPLNRLNTAQWPYPTRALPPPSFVTSGAASMNHSYMSHMAAPSTLRTGPLFPGGISTTAPPSHTSARSSHISISSLVHKFDH